jgi:hypothetical protein
MIVGISTPGPCVMTHICAISARDGQLVYTCLPAFRAPDAAAIPSWSSGSKWRNAIRRIPQHASDDWADGVITIGRILAAVFAACTIAACSPTRAIESIDVLQDLSGTSAKAASEQRTRRIAHRFEVDGRTYAADLYVPRDGAKAVHPRVRTISGSSRSPKPCPAPSFSFSCRTS